MWHITIIRHYIGQLWPNWLAVLLGFVFSFKKFNHYFNFLASIYKVPHPYNDIATFREKKLEKKIKCYSKYEVHIYIITANIIFSCIFLYIYSYYTALFFTSTSKIFNSNPDVYSFKNFKSCIHLHLNLLWMRILNFWIRFPILNFGMRFPILNFWFWMRILQICSINFLLYCTKEPDDVTHFRNFILHARSSDS